MNWQAEMDELRCREALAEELGGAERVKRQHAGGRYTIRERLHLLVDQGSFHEIGKIAAQKLVDKWSGKPAGDFKVVVPVQEFPRSDNAGIQQFLKDHQGQ